jgi:ATP-dependent helicase STH1/SNF2
VFLLSTRAGGLGLNLQSADTVIIYDSDWNPFADMQASARVHRIGQNREVLVVSLSTPDTVERKVLKVQNEKRTVEDMIIGAAIFNDESSVDDRKAVYQAVTAKNQSGGVSNVQNDAQINKIIARTAEELEMFEQMDEERDAKYQQEWERAGHRGDYPRLVTYDELPEYLKIPASDLIKEEELPDIRRSRSRNQLSLLDNITESEYTRLIEEGKDPEEYARELERLRKELRRVIKGVRGVVGSRFDELPTKSELPEYYDIVKNPITFNDIVHRTREGEYNSLRELCMDLKLMAKNAMRFNQEGSLLYQNGEGVLKLIDEELNGKTLDIPAEASHF